MHQVYREIVTAAQEHVKVGRRLVTVRGARGPMRGSRAPSVYRVLVHE